MPKQASVSFLRRSDNQLEQSHSVCGRSNWLEHSQTSITPAAESKCAVYSDLLHISIYSIFLLIEVCGGCTLKLSLICCRDGSETGFLHFLNFLLIQPVLTPEV